MPSKFGFALILAILILSNASMAIAADLPPKEGRLVKWSEQKYTSTKKIIFVHGWNLVGAPTGKFVYISAETKFAIKMDNLNYLGNEKFKNPTSHLAEFWLYEYDPCQDIIKIADDLAKAIKQNPEFKGSQIAIIGHSQGGIVLYELVKRYPTLINGGICLGAPIKSTPLAQKPMRDGAVKKVFKNSWSVLIPKFDALASGTDQLSVDRAVSSELPGNLYLFAGKINTTRIKLPDWLTGRIKHYIDILDVIFTAGKNFFTGIEDGRQFAELLADVINKSDWDGGAWGTQNDGLVPVSSALAGATKEDERHRVEEDTDHSELITGKGGDLNLDSEILDILDLILNLMPREDVVDPNLPEDFPDLSGILKVESPLKQTRFAYVLNDQIHLTDASWQRDYIVPLGGQCSSPMFNPKKLGMTFTWNKNGNSNIFLFDEEKFCAITDDGKSHSASFSPNGGWITYQSGNELVTYNFKSQKRYSLVSGINLASPPIWVAEWLKGKIYFANRNLDGEVDVYCVSPRWRKARDINKLRPIIRDAGVPHIIRGYFGGIISTQSEWGSAGELVCQRIHLISGMLRNRCSLEMRLDSKNNRIDPIGNWSNRQFLIETSQGVRFESVLLDRQDLQLYLIDKEEGLTSIYRLNYNFINSDDDTAYDEVFSEIIHGGSQLDINMLAK